MDKIKLTLPVIVEGKYDKIALGSVCEANIITTDGFGVFKNAEKRALIKRLSERGMIVLCDSDRAGGLIRSHLSGIVPKERLYQLYVPQIKGKERRKAKPSAEGLLGVEGVGVDVLRECLERFLTLHPEAQGDDGKHGEPITKTDMYFARLSGAEDSSRRRDELCQSLSLPRGMSANAMLSALNMIITREEFLTLCEKCE